MSGKPMQHQSHALQIANFSFSSMIGIAVLMIVSLMLSETPILMQGGVPRAASLSTPVLILGIMALVSSISRIRVFVTGIEKHWVQNQIQFLLSVVISVYIGIAWFVG
ncbi:MAG: hypothetical protein H6981_12375 [Gammaproteobacteria bacterium]|nr:hypothetical protein [Gammaproteobacteria bacterium]MCP5137586.1 hypothetical protein [Gammaproteobacteria bacterium]